MYNKITQREAYDILQQGKPIYLLPNKTSVHSVWIRPHKIETPMSWEQFEALVNEYWFFNCCAELGTSVVFYVKGDTAA